VHHTDRHCANAEWDRYKAAKEALAIDTLKPENVRWVQAA